MIDKITTIIKKLFGTRAAGFYLLAFAIAIGVATFVENDYGTSRAQNVIFKARWFEMLLALFGTTILYNIKVFRMVENKKWANLIFHLAIIVILIGAGVTRYFGYEGMMHIREGQTANTFLSSENFINFKLIRNGKKYSFEEPANYATLGANKLDEEYQIGNDLLAVSLQEFVPNPKEVATESPDGVPMLKVVIAGANGREEYWLRQGDKTNINGVNYNFNNTVEPTAFNIFYTGDSLTLQHTQVITQMVMATQTTSTLEGNMPHPLKLRSMYTLGQNGFVFGDFKKKGQLQVQVGDKKVKNESVLGARFAVSYKGETKNIILTGSKGSKGQPKVLNFGADRLEMSYGAKDIKLPFSVKCRDFILERYPGTDNPSSYASEVTLVDQRDNNNRDQRIFMNNVMDHDGYRFFQSSYDPDEAGTYLSVNHDFWGTWISYIGYILLTIGLAMTFFAKNTRFSDHLCSV